MIESAAQAENGDRHNPPIFFEFPKEKEEIETHVKMMQLRLWEFIEMAVTSEDNANQSWQTKYRRHNRQKYLVTRWLKDYKLPQDAAIRITRFGARKMDEDNLSSSVKYVKDAVANMIFPGLAPGRADGSKTLYWYYHQVTGPKQPKGVKIEIFSKERVEKKSA